MPRRSANVICMGTSLMVFLETYPCNIRFWLPGKKIPYSTLWTTDFNKDYWIFNQVKKLRYCNQNNLHQNNFAKKSLPSEKAVFFVNSKIRYSKTIYLSNTNFSFTLENSFPKKDSFFSGKLLITLATVCESRLFY